MYQLSEAIILRHLDYGEADRIVTFLTPDQGQMKGFARGARKSRRRFGPALEPYARVRLHWAASRGEMVTLREAELIDLRHGLRTDLGALALAAYGCELVEVLLAEEQGHARVFDLLDAFLAHLAAAGPTPATRLLLELRLLQMAGYVPHLLHCSICCQTLQGTEAAFDPARGGSLCCGCAGPGGRLAVGTLGSLARLLRTPATAFADIRLGERTLAEGSAAVTAALRLHLHRPLRTLAFLQQVTAQP
ncbi:MAG: DNA repair protein RecO [Desulfuromonadales bacterium]|nr:DNA repair protein RecO [Desulfuromonadales bacterium]